MNSCNRSALLKWRKFSHKESQFISTEKFLAYLLQNNVLSWSEWDEFEQKELDKYEAKAKKRLIKILIHKNDKAFDVLLTALDETDQSHVRKSLEELKKSEPLLVKDEDDDKDDGLPPRPELDSGVMDPHVKDILRKNAVYLVETLSVRLTLLAMLYQKYVLTRQEFETLKGMVRNERPMRKRSTRLLLYIIGSQNQDSFLDFIETLEREQGFIVDYILRGHSVDRSSRTVYDLQCSGVTKGFVELEVVKTLQPPHGAKAMEDLVQKNDLNTIKAAVDAGLPTDSIYNGKSLLHMAARGGDRVMVKYMLDIVSIVNHTDEKGNTALMESLIADNRSATDAILATDRDLDLTTRNREGHDAMKLALLMNNHRVVRFLKNRGVEMPVSVQEMSLKDKTTD